MKQSLFKLEIQFIISAVVTTAVCLLIINYSNNFWFKLLAYGVVWYSGWYTIYGVFYMAYHLL